MNLPSGGLYAITPSGLETSKLLGQVAAVLKGGAVLLQYREKDWALAKATAPALQALCREFRVPFIINDFVGLAADIGADGVHLGREDAAIVDARQRLGADALIGVSCYDSVDRAELAARQGASYVAFGRFFPSGTKPLASPAQLETLTKAKQAVNLPIVAIGGIVPDNGAALLAAGADFLAVIGGLYAADPETAAKAYLGLFAETAATVDAAW